MITLLIQNRYSLDLNTEQNGASYHYSQATDGNCNEILNDKT